MNVKLWQIALFVMVIMAVTWASFPYDRDLARLYLDSGNIDKATSLVNAALEQGTPDFELLQEAAKLHHLLGEPDQAIALMEKAVADKPRNMNSLQTLANYYDWSLRPADAAAIYERMAEVQPSRESWDKLLGYYRYFGFTDKETMATAELVPYVVAGDPKRLDPYIRAMAPDLMTLAERHTQEGEDPYADYLLRRLYILAEQYQLTLASGSPTPTRTQFAIWAEELYLGTDHADLGTEFARRLDAGWNSMDGRLALATVLRWNGRNAEALPVLAELESQAPNREDVLVALAEAGRDAGDGDTAAKALEKLLKRHPDSADYQRRLVDAYLSGNKFDQAMGAIRELMRKTGDVAGNIHALLRAAVFSDNKEAMSAALKEADKYDLGDPETVRARADVHMALDQPLAAYTALKPLVLSPAGTDEDLTRLLDAAGGADNEAVLLEALNLASKKRPGDISILRTAAQATAGAGKAVQALTLLRRIPAASRIRQDYADMLDLAGGSGDPAQVRRAVADVAKGYPNDLQLAEQSALVSSWVLPPVESYPAFRRAAVLSGGNKGAVDRMLEMASFADNPPLLTKAVALARKLRPKDEDYVFMQADALAAAGDADQLSKMVAAFASRHGNDPARLRKWAGYAEGAGNSEQAYQLYLRLHANAPDDKGLREAVIRNAEFADHYAVAADLLAPLSDRAPKDFELARRTGTDYAAAGISDRAVVYLGRASALRPDDQEVRLALLEAATFGGDDTKLIEFYEAMAAKRPLTQDERLTLAEAYANTGANAKGLALLDEYRNADPLAVRPGLLLARLLAATGKAKQAETVLKRLYAQAGNDPDVLTQVGSEALNNGQLDLAGRAFRSLLKVRPGDPLALKGQAIVSGDQGDVENGIRQFKVYLRRFPNDADARYRLAELYLAAERPKLASAEFVQAEKLLKSQKRDTQAGTK